jgi:hypothetical protein
MMALLRLFWNLCLFQQAPQDIPCSKALLTLLVLIYVVVAFLVLLPQADVLKNLLEVSVEISVIFAFVWLLLATVGKLSRYTQVLCAFLGSDALISLFAMPVLLSTADSESVTIGAMSVLLALMLWHWLVCGHIIRHALSQPLSLGLAVALLYSLGSYQFMAWLFPVSGV